MSVRYKGTVVAGSKGEQGPQGPTGPQGEVGPKGDPGEGVPAGGTSGQVLAKTSDADYDTQWVDSTGGSTSFLVNAPIGAIVAWSDDAGTVPEGWHVCDGTEGTLDLRDKFILGAGTTHAVGETGGEETHELTTQEMPNHSHQVYARTNSQLGQGIPLARTVSDGASATVVTGDTGGSQAHNNMPPYYALLFIQKIGTTPTDYATTEEMQTAIQEALQTVSFTPGDGITIQGDTISVETPVKGITQAEYDALPEEEKKTGLYVITDAEVGSGGVTMDQVNAAIDAAITGAIGEGY